MKIPVSYVGGQNIVYWEDIEQVFLGVNHIQNGDVVVNKLRDSDGKRIEPDRIKHCPGVVLDVVAPTAVKYVSIDSATSPSMLAPTDGRTETPVHAPIDYHRPGAIINKFDTNLPTSSTTTLAESVSSLAEEPSTGLSSTEPRQATMIRGNTTHIQNQYISVTAAIEQARQSGKPLTSAAFSSLIASKLTPASMAKSGFERTVIHKLDGLYNQGAITQKVVREVLEVQKQMNDRLVLIQDKTKAILTQQLELAEYPIPRLFIVLPEEPAKYDPGNWFRTRFRLHFICECGKHTEASNSKIPHHLHLAKHEGYLVREPTEFFKNYGPFLLLMLELIKFGTSIAGHVVPTLASLKVVELADSVIQSVELVLAKIDYSLDCIDNQLAKAQASSPGDFIDTEPREPLTQQDLANYLSNVEGLEGVELRQLGSFLKTSEEENLLGNLYRMTTSDGHVKWVCRDHYRASYQEKHTQALRDVVKLTQGEFDEQLGRITITLGSSFAATEFYYAVNQAKGVLELNVDLNWRCTRSDLEALGNALQKSGVLILRLCLREVFQTSILQSTSAQYKALFHIGELPHMKLFHIDLPEEAVKLPSFKSKKPSLCKLSIYLNPASLGEKEHRILVETLKINSTLTSLNLHKSKIGDNGVKALAEALEANSTLTTLNLMSNSIGDDGAKALAEALKTNSTLTTLDLCDNMIGNDGVKALAEALKTNSTLTTLNLKANYIGDDGAKVLAEALKTNSTLTTLNLMSNSIGYDGAKALAEALKTNSTLTTLNLKANSIGGDGVKALAEALKINSTLTILGYEIWGKKRSR
ncbi:MAG: hypothetical protein J3R72DRAFT_426292 [Linnemannia gamsii]|nr:MAG: hypothetical protein J3R72DRAFT_426292 [Linnemannia gamsii]